MTVKFHQLSNGFRVVTEHMPSLESASIGVWVMAGGRHETVAQNGIAHFLEHMAFKGTKRRNALQIAEAIEDVGGFINAYTSREVTAYYARVLRKDVSLAFDVISDIILNSTFDPREIEVERGVILQEIGQSLDTPDDVIFDWLQAEAYPDHPLGRTILGPAENVRGFSGDDLRAFVDQRYGPDQLILSAAGAVDHDELVRLAEESFGALPSRGAAPAQLAKFAGGGVYRQKDLEQAHVAFAFGAPAYGDDDFYAAQIYAVAMGGGMSSRLFQEVREKRGLCYSIFAQNGAFVDTGMMTVYAGTSGDSVAELTKVVIEEMKRSAVDFSEAELERARAQMKAGLLMGLEGASARCERLARLLQIHGRVPDLAETIAKIDAVRLEDLRAVSQKLAVESPMAQAFYGPVSGAPDPAQIGAMRAA